MSIGIVFVYFRRFLILSTWFSFSVVASDDVKVTPAAVHEAAHYVYYILSGNDPSSISKIEVDNSLEGRNYFINQLPLKNVSAVYMSGHYYHWLLVHKKKALNNTEFVEFLDYYRASSEYKEHIGSLNKIKLSNNMQFQGFVDTEIQHAKFFIENRFKIAFPKVKRLALHLVKLKSISGRKALELVNN
ncbi:hypothetical protein I6F48_00355 [Pseudoalteromonas sp. SWYJ118]|jgi:hypothetical protein|uniref:hypothetical protein n=1 Tax=Pseudoalteromonas sp. SWYJ118 TaxID=2792062 RepID=UPI0018CF8D5E|nr:hypothetical protein [Pseudoalteromonas sp. SWYJ118]MBH0074015.1 hypothetical protein [Pseudoalteromonas sp. SWYJ118]